MIKAKEATYVETIRKLEIDVNFLKEKIVVYSEKLAKELEANTNLYSTVGIKKQSSAKETTAGSSDEERKKFLTGTNSVELLNTMDLKGNTIYFMEMLTNAVPLYGQEGVMFVKTDNPCTMAMQM